MFTDDDMTQILMSIYFEFRALDFYMDVLVYAALRRFSIVRREKVVM